jgi:hypothetical protein
MRAVPSILLATLLAALVLPSAGEAQFKNGNQTVLLDLPRASQRAVVAQRIGVTDITIVYHRPLVNGRKIFGDVVPYSRVWRAGANDNTTIEFTDPVLVEGQAVPAGRYGLHAVPGENEWTIILSKNATSWGSFSYDPNEDQLRVKVTPRPGTFREALTYEFDDVKSAGATIALSWEKTVVPVAVSVDTKALTLAGLRRQMRHLAGYKPETYYEAALYCLDNEFNYDEALKWIDQAVAEGEERFENLGRTQDAKDLLAKALALASPQQKYGYGERLIREKQLAQAHAFFRDVTAASPDVWLNWYGLARVQARQGDRAAAKASLEKALDTAKLPAQKAGLRRMLERLAAGQDIG